MIKAVITAEDLNSRLISAANVSAFVTGTGAAYTLYSGNAVTAFPTPAVSDHQGVLEFYADPGNYDFDIRDPHTGISRRYYNVALYSDSVGGTDFVLKSGDTMVGDLIINSVRPSLRLQGTEGSAREVRALESAGIWVLQLNVGTANSPIWGTLAEQRIDWLALGRISPSTGTAAVPGGAKLYLASEAGCAFYLDRFSSNNGSPALFQRKARGNLGSASAAQNNDQIGLYRFDGHDGVAFQQGASMEVFAVGAWSPTARGNRIDFFTIASNSTTPVRQLRLDHDGNSGFRTASFAGGMGVLGIGNATGFPTGNPSVGGLLLASAGAGVWVGSSGTKTTFGPAEPHCPRCGRDFAVQYRNEEYGELTLCLWCMAEASTDAPWIISKKSWGVPPDEKERARRSLEAEAL
jgi:hypothetical protein